MDKKIYDIYGKELKLGDKVTFIWVMDGTIVDGKETGNPGKLYFHDHKNDNYFICNNTDDQWKFIKLTK